MDDDVSELAGSVTVEQIMLRALMRELVKRLAAQSANPEHTIREIGESLQDFVNGYLLLGANDGEMERAKERARMNFDALIRSFERSG